MIVAKYDVLFTQLSWYNMHLVPTERMRIKWFIDGCVRALYRVVAAQMKTIYSYSNVLDCGRMLEIREIEAHAS